jgi:hypothetical protein
MIRGISREIQPQQPAIANPYKEENNQTHIGQRIITSLEDQWAIVGVRRSGKSTFCRELLYHLRDSYSAVRTYILDSSNDKDFRSFPGIHIETEEAPDVLRTPGGVQIWRPSGIDDIAEYDKWLFRILKAEEPAIVLIDELSSLVKGNTSINFPRGYSLLSKQGGKNGVSLISCTQEAAYIPRQTLGQTTHIVRFRLLDEHDAKKVDKLLRRPESERGSDPRDKHGFFHRRTDTDGGPHYYKNHREFFGG